MIERRMKIVNKIHAIAAEYGSIFLKHSDYSISFTATKSHNENTNLILKNEKTPQIKGSFNRLIVKSRNQRYDFFVLNVVVLTIMIFLQPD